MTKLANLEWKTIGEDEDILSVKVTTGDGRDYVVKIMRHKDSWIYDLYNRWFELVDQNSAESALQLCVLLSYVFNCEVTELVDVALAAENVCRC